MTRKPVRIGIGGPVGSGKTALVDALCKTMRASYRLGVITNDIFTREDMEFLVRSEALGRSHHRRPDRRMSPHGHPGRRVDELRRHRGDGNPSS